MEPESNTTDALASRWAARLDAGTASSRRNSRSWIPGSPAIGGNHGALIRARAAWLDADRLIALSGTSLSPSQDGAGVGRDRSAPMSKQRIQLRFGWRLAAGVAALGIFLAAFWILHTPASATYVSEVGELRRIELSDGSELTLNTRHSGFGAVQGGSTGGRHQAW